MSLGVAPAQAQGAAGKAGLGAVRPAEPGAPAAVPSAVWASRVFACVSGVFGACSDC